MGLRANWHGQPYHDYSTKKWLVTFETEVTPQIYQETKDKPLLLDIKEFREKRSLNANSYFHVLVGKIAASLRTSHTEVHNQMIAKYGHPDEDIKNIIMKDSIPWERLDTIHLRPTVATRVLDDGELYRVYTVMRGSHTYDTKEMSVLIDGVVSDAKELGIETLTPDELERIKQQWESQKA